MNTVCIDGRISKGIELKTTQSGKSVVSFTIAHDDGWGENKKTYWLDIVAWNGTAENVAKFFHKGSKVFITGKLTERTYNTKEGQKRKVTEIVALTIDFGDSKQGGKANNTPVQQSFGQTVDDGTIPF